jgi:hypothetical protein
MVAAFFERSEIERMVLAHGGFVLGDMSHAVVDELGFAVPQWLDRRVRVASTGQGVVMPIGGQAAMRLWLDQLKAGGSPDQQSRIDALIADVLPAMKEGELWTPEVVRGLQAFRKAWREEAAQALYRHIIQGREGFIPRGVE